MGSWVSATFGYGIVLPSGEDDEYEPSEWVEQFSTRENGEDFEYWDIDWYEAAEALCEDNDLSFHFGYVHDYSGGGALFAGKTLHTYETVKSFDSIPGSMYTPDLRDAAEKLGIEFDPKWILVVSYG
jgi:hypothetical protein